MASFYVLDASRIDRELRVLEARPLVVGAQTRPPQETLFYTSMFGSEMDIPPSYTANPDVHPLGLYEAGRNQPRPATLEEKDYVRGQLIANNIDTIRKAIAEAVR
jgi:hypothetical protein